jgi:hypothetical protein
VRYNVRILCARVAPALLCPYQPGLEIGEYSPHSYTQFLYLAYFPYFGKSKKFWEQLIAYFLWYDIDHIEHDAFNNSSLPREHGYRAVS